MPTTRKRAPAPIEITFRITVLHPVPGVTLMLQRGPRDLVPSTGQTSDTVSFDFTLRLGDTPVSGRPRWLGEFAQGTPEDRFVYVNAGQYAGQKDTPWARRAKIKLATITSQQVREVLRNPGHILEACIEGTGRDGGPSCATVPLTGGRWQVVTAG